MERLTESNPSWIDDELWERACEPDCEEIDAVYRRLKDYEDLEERLNKVYGDCDGLLLRVIETLEKHPCIDIANNTLKSRLLTDEDVDKWEEYKQLEEQDRLLKLPISKDTPVYSIEYCCGNNSSNKSGMCVKGYCENCVDKDYFIKIGIARNCTITEINKSVFLTEEKAKAKLKELKNRESA